jgi:hypothetical protein
MVAKDSSQSSEGDTIRGKIDSADDASNIAIGKDIHQEVHYHYGYDSGTSGKRTIGNMAPKPPGEFVDRPHEYEALKELLLADGDRPVAITAALRGAGGYGKSTLAQALCHDPDVVAAFPDGILWTTLGENPGEVTG